MQIILIIITILIFQINICLAENEIELASPEEFELLIKDWECDWISFGNPNFFKGIYKFNINDVNGKLVTGRFNNTFCQGEKELEGEIKNGKLYWVIKSPPKPCEGGNLQANAKLYKDNDDNLYMKGQYRGYAGFGTSTRDAGRFECK